MSSSGGCLLAALSQRSFLVTPEGFLAEAEPFVPPPERACGACRGARQHHEPAPSELQGPEVAQAMPVFSRLQLQPVCPLILKAPQRAVFEPTGAFLHACAHAVRACSCILEARPLA